MHFQLITIYKGFLYYIYKIIDNFESKNNFDDDSRNKNEENQENEENKNSSINLYFTKNQGEDNFNDAGFKILTEKSQSKYIGR